MRILHLQLASDFLRIVSVSLAFVETAHSLLSPSQVLSEVGRFLVPGLCLHSYFLKIFCQLTQLVSFPLISSASFSVVCLENLATRRKAQRIVLFRGFFAGSAVLLVRQPTP